MNKYYVKHKKQTLVDFQNDCHRFTFWYNRKQIEVSCYGTIDVFFDDENIPEDVLCEVQNEIYRLIDQNESQWSVPNGAREIADSYCQENFN